MNYESEVEVPGIKLTESMVGNIYHSVLWDNPFIFSVGEYMMWHALSPDKSKIKMTTLCDKASEKKYREEIEKAVNQILSVPRLMEMSEFQKEVFVHDFVINNIEYDRTLGDGGAKIQPYTVYGALVEHKAVCEGIAKTVKLLLNMLDVQCIVASGKYDGHGHSWNIVKIDKWAYNLDVTMDMGQVIHKGRMRYNFFNFRDADISNYAISNPDLMPKCTAIKNNYVIRAAGFVSNYERLKKYMQKSMEKQKACIYFKPNRNIEGDYKKIQLNDFEEEIKRAYSEVSQQLGTIKRCFIDTFAPMEIVNVEVVYEKKHE